MTVLACVDGSRYTPASATYAAWAARRLGRGRSRSSTRSTATRVTDVVDRSGRMAPDMAETALEEFARLNEARSRLLQEQGRLILDARGGA